MAAAAGGHHEALYSLAVIQLNGSGGSKDNHDLRAGAARSIAWPRGHALRAFLQDGYGVRCSVRTCTASSSRTTPASSPSRLRRQAATPVAVGRGAAAALMLPVDHWLDAVASAVAHPGANAGALDGWQVWRA